MFIGVRVYQLGGDTNPVARLADTALEDVIDLQLLGDLGNVQVLLFLVRKGRSIYKNKFILRHPMHST